MAFTEIRLWKESATANNSTNIGGSGLNWAEGQLPSTVNNTARLQTAQLRKWYSGSEAGWIDYHTTASVASQTVLKVAADVTAWAVQGRQVRVRGGSATVYATILSASFTAETSITVEDQSGSLSASMSVIGLGLLPIAAPRRVEKLDVSSTLSVGGPLGLAGAFNWTSGWGVVAASNVASISTSGTVQIDILTLSPAPAAYVSGLTIAYLGDISVGKSSLRVNVNGLGEKEVTGIATGPISALKNAPFKIIRYDNGGFYAVGTG